MGPPGQEWEERRVAAAAVSTGHLTLIKEKGGHKQFSLEGAQRRQWGEKELGLCEGALGSAEEFQCQRMTS